MKTEETQCSETLAYKIETSANHPKERIRHSEHGESLKARNAIAFGSHNESEMYITALLFFNKVFLQFHMPFLAIHKLPDSIRKGFRLLPNPCMHRFFHFINAKPATT
jgi:hypothetical protein